MGLDQYMYSRAKGSEDPNPKGDIAYFRKHPNLHGWMQRLYAERTGVTDPKVFNCEALELTEEDLNALERDVLNSALPDTKGFFFGESSRDQNTAVLIAITTARLCISQGETVFYNSWG